MAGPAWFLLNSQELGRRKAGQFLEDSREMVGVLESQLARSLADVIPAYQKVLAFVYDIGVNVTDGRTACRLVDQLPEMTC